MKKRIPVGGKLTEVAGDTELITNENCGVSDWNSLNLVGFYIRNEDTKDIYVKINGSGELLLKQGEMFNLRDMTYVESCIVVTPSTVRWGGLL
ncbi:Uncharacterised protein [[Clostridium] sordellii]|uniref:hypothetical protein n=1 Tax=Paraclostridium sordellii TaxID=1505 RepID=UPI0005E6A225|nr:hypothetical protein [Paeniclostridium sordellii]CEQ01749.1 Uncharacterised protein [[Clostridium] sordellii] [Paeniclostridium sordellii]